MPLSVLAQDDDLVETNELAHANDLAQAIEEGSVEKVKSFLENSPTLANESDRWNTFPILLATKEGHLEIVKLLLEYDIDTDVVDVFGNNILMLASLYGHEELVVFYLSYPDLNLDVNQQNNWDETSLNLAARYGHPNISAILLQEEGIDASLRDSYQRTPLIVASANANIEIVKQLAAVPGVDIDAVDYRKSSALTYASRYGYNSMVNYLIDAGASINLRDAIGMTPLMWAVRVGYFSTAVILVINYADANIRDNEGNTALMFACYNNNFSMASLLLGVSDINLDITNDRNLNALGIASRIIHNPYQTSIYEIIHDRMELKRRSDIPSPAI